MKVNVTPEWCLAMARREGDLEVGVGPRAPYAEPEEVVVPSPTEARIAFGRFVQLIRRQRGMSIEQLAEEASLDLAELVQIEDDLHHVPELRSVYQLSRVFNLPQQRLMQLAGLAVPKSDRFRAEVLKFAARSESTEALTPEERHALEQFVRVLSERQEG